MNTHTRRRARTVTLTGTTADAEARGRAEDARRHAPVPHPPRATTRPATARGTGHGGAARQAGGGDGVARRSPAANRIRLRTRPEVHHPIIDPAQHPHLRASPSASHLKVCTHALAPPTRARQAWPRGQQSQGLGAPTASKHVPWRPGPMGVRPRPMVRGLTEAVESWASVEARASCGHGARAHRDPRTIPQRTRRARCSRRTHAASALLAPCARCSRRARAARAVRAALALRGPHARSTWCPFARAGRAAAARCPGPRRGWGPRAA